MKGWDSYLSSVGIKNIPKKKYLIKETKIFLTFSGQKHDNRNVLS